jgi:pectin methylesterase-like acyl-CoA thioesterase
VALTVVGAALWAPQAASANHSVLVEGEQDYDGDGLTGLAEDADGADTVFGTITAALGSLNSGANQNGRITIVTSGRFVEQVVITAANGNVSLEAALGVDANVEAVKAGDAGNAARQAIPGIIVNAPATRQVQIRNIMSRNWTVGFMVMGESRVTIDQCRAENNVNYNVLVQDNARAAISGCSVNAAGFRSGAPPVDNTPNPGTGIGFNDASTGSVYLSTVSGSFNAGIKDGSTGQVKVSHVQLFDNNVAFLAG